MGLFKEIRICKECELKTYNFKSYFYITFDLAKMFYYQFSSPMFNKSLPETHKNNMPRMRLAINLFGIVKEINGDKVVFYEGWDPQKRGEKIMKKFFVKKL